jgi:hypothetical protein
MDEPQHDTPPGRGPPPRASSGSDLLLVLLALAVLVAGGAWWWFHRAPEVPSPAPIIATPVAPAPAAPPPAPGPVVSPERERELLEAVSVSAAYRKWLAQGDVVQRWAVVIDNIAEGVSPRARLPFLVPAQPFKAVKRGDRWVVAEASFKRYDLLADVVASVDVPAAVGAYRALHGPLEAAYRALGYPEGSLDKVTAAALHRLAAAPVHDGDLEVAPGGEGPASLYLLASPRLEALGTIEKHLLRMGPRNTRLLQAKARQLEQALGFAAAGTK